MNHQFSLDIRPGFHLIHLNNLGLSESQISCPWRLPDLRPALGMKIQNAGRSDNWG